MIYIKKLKYATREQGIADLIAKQIYTEELEYCDGVHAVVDIGKVIDQEATFDEQGNILTEPTYRDGYHFDIMVEKEIDFGAKEITPNNPKHTFAGFNE